MSQANDGKRRRVVVIALDAADSGLLQQEIEDGGLPHLAKLQADGAWGILGGPQGFGSGAAWATFATGVTPAAHGRYFYRQVVPGSYEARTFAGDDVRHPAFWDRLSEQGKRVAVFDAPSMPVAEGINGISVADWLTHDLVYQELRTSPSTFAAELTERFGANALMKCDRPGGRTLDEHRELLEILTARVDQRARANAHYYPSDDWDLFLTTFTEPHCVGHQCWHLRDPGHPLNDAASTLPDPVLTVYRAIDDAIGELLATVDDHTTVLVVSATGMGPNYTGNLMLDEILRRRDGIAATRKVALTARAKAWAKRILPNEVRRRYRPLKRRVEESVQVDDRARRPSFAVPHNDITGAIRLNIVGRETAGVLHRGEEVDRYVDELRRDLLALRNLDTGEPVVDEVIRVSDEIDGIYLDDLPDVFVRWARSAYPDRVGSDRIGEIEFRHRGNRTGDHLPDHIFFAVGPDIRPGRVDGRSILDLAPTIGEILGVEIAGDGSPIDEIFTDPVSTDPT